MLVGVKTVTQHSDVEGAPLRSPVARPGNGFLERTINARGGLAYLFSV